MRFSIVNFDSVKIDTAFDRTLIYSVIIDVKSIMFDG